jgi:SSS family solute:Na+ symporter
MLGPAFIISPGLLQKVYGAANPRAVRVGVGVQALALGLFAFVPVLLGMAARVVAPDVASPNLVLPTVLVEALPVWLGALGLAAVFSAEVSTCDAILFMLATSLSQDLYRQFVNPAADDRTILAVARLAAVVGGALGVVLAIQLPTVIGALSIFYTLLGVSLFVPVMAGLYVNRVGTAEAMAAIVGGVSFVLAVQLSGQAGRAVWSNPNVGGLAAAALGEVNRSRGARWVRKCSGWTAKWWRWSDPAAASARRWRWRAVRRARTSCASTSTAATQLPWPGRSRRPAGRRSRA